MDSIITICIFNLNISKNNILKYFKLNKRIFFVQIRIILQRSNLITLLI